MNYKIQNAERKIEEYELKTEEFTDLLEDAIAQASRALTKERLEYIASTLKNSLTNEELEQTGKKKILTLLSELSDAEIIWLKSYTFKIRHVSLEEYKEYLEVHKAVLQPFNPNLRYVEEPEDIKNKKALIQSYVNNLLRLGLINERFDRIKDQEMPEFDEMTGKIRATDYYCNHLGRMLLKFIDLKTII